MCLLTHMYYIHHVANVLWPVLCTPHCASVETANPEPQILYLRGISGLTSFLPSCMMPLTRRSPAGWGGESHELGHPLHSCSLQGGRLGVFVTPVMVSCWFVPPALRSPPLPRDMVRPLEMPWELLPLRSPVAPVIFYMAQCTPFSCAGAQNCPDLSSVSRARGG